MSGFWHLCRNDVFQIELCIKDESSSLRTRLRTGSWSFLDRTPKLELGNEQTSNELELELELGNEQIPPVLLQGKQSPKKTAAPILSTSHVF